MDEHIFNSKVAAALSGISFTVIMQGISLVLSVIAGALTVGYMYNQWKLSKKKVEAFDRENGD